MAISGGVAESTTGAISSSDGRACRLLIVEDHAPDAILITERIRREGLDASVRFADDRATFELALAEPPDLILCDFNLPSFGALEALDILKDRALEVPLIVISGALRDDDAVECLHRGAVDYVLKDRPARLVPAIRRALDDRRRQVAMDESEAAFLDRAGLLQAVFETAADAMVVFDDEGRIVERNSAMRRLCEMPALPEAVEDGTAGIIRMLLRRISRGETDRGEVEIVDEEGVRQIVEYTANRRFIADRHLVVLHDVTVRRALLAEALEHHRLEAVGRLAGGIAHDFNNILAAIVMFAELALAEMSPDGPGRAEIDEVLRAADRASDLVRQILVFSRQQVVQPTVVDVRDIVANLDSILRRPLGSHIVLTVETTEVPTTVLADTAQLEQVIFNLVVNARDALPDGGNITIRISHERIAAADDARLVAPGDYVRLEVADDGTGMDTTTKALVFEPFFTTKPLGRGTGLGLATAYGTLQQLGGAIWVDSAVGQGSCFVVLIPAAAAGPPIPSGPPGKPTGDGPDSDSATAVGGRAGACGLDPKTGEPRTVVIAEDDPAVRTILVRVLSGSGFRTLVAGDGLEALNLVQGADLIDLLVSDVVMPGMTGPVLATRLLAEGRVPKVILISGYRGFAPLGELELDPRVTFLAKPFDVNTLRDAVARLITSGS